MRRKLDSFFSWLLRASAVAALALMEFALSPQCALAQATYFYTGNHYTSVSGDYTASMSVTATLQLASWLPPNQPCLNVTTLPGFHLILKDGINTLDSWTGTYQVYKVLVSTGDNGEILGPWFVELSAVAPSLNQIGTEEQTFPIQTPPFNTYCYRQASDGPPIVMDVANQNGGSAGNTNSPGAWSYPSALALTTMLTNEVILQQIGPGTSLSDKLTQIGIDITTNDGYDCSDLTNFANAVKAQSGKKITAAQSAFILQTVQIMQSELNCGG
jgi:hypothetical protein